MRQLKITKQITQRAESSISLYFQDICKYPLITSDEETELSERIKSGDNSALEKLVVSNLRFVISVAKQYTNQGLSFPDLINEGNVGLIRAAYRFDITRGFKFISYAVWWIRQSIIQAIAEQNRLVRLPLNRVAAINKIAKAIPYLEHELEREPSDEELANFLDLNKDEISFTNTIKQNQLSFDKPITNDGISDLTLYDIIHTDNISSPDKQLIVESDITNIQRALNHLTEREASVIIMSYGLFKSEVYSQDDIGTKHGITNERVRQIRNHGLSKLKSLLQGKTELY